MTATRQVLILLVCLFPFVSPMGCSTHADNSVNPGVKISQGFIPLAVGNRWIWRYTYYDTLGVPEYNSFDTLTVLSDTLIGTEKWYLGRWMFETSFGANRASGFWVWGDARAIVPGSQPLLWYKYPGKTGERYYPAVNQADTTYPVTILDTSAQVTVPIGTFRCYKYKLGELSLREEHYQGIVYISPNEGVVLQEDIGFTSAATYVRSRSELISRIIK